MMLFVSSKHWYSDLQGFCEYFNLAIDISKVFYKIFDFLNFLYDIYLLFGSYNVIPSYFILVHHSSFMSINNLILGAISYPQLFLIFYNNLLYAVHHLSTHLPTTALFTCPFILKIIQSRESI